MRIKNFYIVLVAATFFAACNPTKEQLAKEKERTETVVNTGVEPLRNEVSQLKNEIKTMELKSELALAKVQLENIQKPKEFKTQSEQTNEINALNSKIEELQNQISSAESEAASAVTAIDTTQKK